MRWLRRLFTNRQREEHFDYLRDQYRRACATGRLDLNYAVGVHSDGTVTGRTPDGNGITLQPEDLL